MVDGKRCFLFVLLGWILLFVACFAWSSLSPDGERVIEPLRSSWRLASAFPPFFEWCAPVLALVVAVVSASGSASDARPGAREILVGAFLPGLVAVALVSVLYFFAGPAFEASRAIAERQSARYERATARAAESARAGDWVSADAALGEAKSVWDSGPEVLAMRLSVAEGLSRSREKTEATTAVAEKPSGSGALAALDAAMKAAERESWFDAHWYATTAFRIDPTLVAAQRLAARAWTMIASSEASDEEIARSKLYARKKAGYEAFSSGDALDAYSIFLELSADHGDDPDVRAYLAKSLEALSRTGFFVDEYLEAKGGSKTWDFAASIVREELDWILCSKTALATDDAVYFEGFYLVALDRGGARIREISAPYAKLTDEALVLRAVDRADPDRVWQPSSKPAPSDPVAAFIVDDQPFSRAAVSTRVLASLAPPGLQAGELVAAASAEARLGGDARVLAEEACARFTWPLSALVAACLAAATGLRLRCRAPSFPRGYLLLVPPFAAALAPLLGIASWLWRGFIALLARLAPDPGTATSVAISGAVAALALSMLFLAGSRPHEGHPPVRDR